MFWVDMAIQNDLPCISLAQALREEEKAKKWNPVVRALELLFLFVVLILVYINIPTSDNHYLQDSIDLQFQMNQTFKNHQSSHFFSSLLFGCHKMQS